MSIYKLGSQSFHLIGDRNPLTLSVSITDPIFIMFKLQGCKGCQALEPIFSQLSSVDKRVSYGIVDLSEHRSIAQMSGNSTTPIKKVPSFIIYSNGRPMARFTGEEKNFNTLTAFITDVLPRIHSANQIQQPQYHQPQSFVPNLYGGQASNGQAHLPDIGNAPKSLSNMQNKHPVAMNAHPGMKQCDPDDAECLAIPHDVIPHNTPWEDKFRQLNI